MVVLGKGRPGPWPGQRQSLLHNRWLQVAVVLFALLGTHERWKQSRSDRGPARRLAAVAAGAPQARAALGSLLQGSAASRGALPARSHLLHRSHRSPSASALPLFAASCSYVAGLLDFVKLYTQGLDGTPDEDMLIGKLGVHTRCHASQRALSR